MADDRVTFPAQVNAGLDRHLTGEMATSKCVGVPGGKLEDVQWEIERRELSAV